MKKSGLGFAAICTASIALAGLAVWGGVNIYQVGRQIPAQNQQNDFSPAEAVELAETEPDTELITEAEPLADEYGISVEQDGDIVKLSIPVQENETLYEVKFGYVPDGLECREDGPYALKYHNYENEEDEHAITPGFCRVVDPSEPYTAEYEFISEVDKFKTTAGNTAVFLKRDQGYDMLFVQFEGTPYIEACFIKGFSYEEMHQFADEMYLEETDKEVGSLWKGAPDDSDNFDYDIIFQCEEGSDSMGNYKLAFGWTPEDLSYQTNNTGDGTWNEICIPGENTDDTINTRRSVGYVLYRIEDVSQPFLWTELDVDTATNMETSSGNEAVICTFDDSSAVDARIYVHFKDTPYIAELVTRKLSEKEYLRLINSLYLTESEEQYYTVYQAQEETTYSAPSGYCDPNLMNLVHVGDTVTIDYTVPCEADHAVQMTINSAALQKDFTGITTDCIGLDADYSQYLDENGNLTAHRKEYTTDDRGLQAEIIRDEDIQQYILKLDVTLTRNDEDTEKEWLWNGLCFHGGIFSLEEDNSIRESLYNIGHGTEIVHEPNLNSDAHFAFYTEHEHEKNGIYNLQPHESADVTLYYAVDADQIGNLYLTILAEAGDTSDYINIGKPVLDLCDLTAPE